jgi:hypothetical protein
MSNEEHLMKQQRFEALVRKLASPSSRRLTLLKIVFAAGVGERMARVGLDAASVVAAGCLANGKRCARANECCSGMCRGRKGKKRCRPAPGQGSCTIDKDACSGAGARATCSAGSGADCVCFRRTNGAAFCADGRFDFESACRPCAECPAGAVCISAPLGSCSLCEWSTLCLRPCGAEPE